MAAGLGFKTFTTGEVLTAADTNGYLMQGVLVFASAAARDAAITSPQEGQCCYLKDTDAVLTYSGAAWVGFDDSNAIQNSIVDAKGDLIGATAADTPARLAVGTNGKVLTADSSAATGLAWATPSLVLLNTTTFSAVSSQSVNDVFSATYAYYRLYFTLTANSGTNAAIKLAMRVSSTDTQMSSEYIEQYSTTVTGVESIPGGGGGIFVKSHSTYGSYCKGYLDILDPFTASVQPQASGRFMGVTSAGQPFQYISNLLNDFTTQYTGFTITPSTGTMTGTLRVYGVTI